MSKTNFDSYSAGLSSPAQESQEIDLTGSPIEDVEFEHPCRCIMTAAAGTVSGWLRHDDLGEPPREFPVQAGYNPLMFRKIDAAGSSLTSFIALW